MYFTVGSYMLNCGARPLANGRFLPEVVVTKTEWQARPRTLAVEKGDFSTEYEATEAARQCGLKWIADYG